MFREVGILNHLHQSQEFDRKLLAKNNCNYILIMLYRDEYANTHSSYLVPLLNRCTPFVLKPMIKIRRFQISWPFLPLTSSIMISPSLSTSTAVRNRWFICTEAWKDESACQRLVWSRGSTLTRRSTWFLPHHTFSRPLNFRFSPSLLVPVQSVHFSG